MAYVGSAEGDLWDAYMGAAKSSQIGEKYSFIHSSDDSCATAAGVASAPGVGIARRFDDSPIGYSGEISTEAIVAWAKSASVPKLITFSEDYIESIFAEHNPALILFTEETGAGYQAVF